MENKLSNNVFQQWIDDPNTQLPSLLANVLSPISRELGKLTVVHPTDNDPCLISEKFGTIAIWFKF